MKTCLVLLRRDLMLIKMNMMKRIGIVFGVSLLINLLSVLQEQKWILTEGLTGVEAAVFRENPMSFPVCWMLISISGILISFDFVRPDFYEYSSNILVRVRKKYFWLSKVLAGALLSLLLVLLFIVTYGAAGFLYSSVYGEPLLEPYQWRGVLPYLFCGIFSGYCIFQLVALFFKEAAGMIIVLAYLILGMSSDGFWYPVNHLMAVRSLEMNPLGVGTFTENMIFNGVIIAAVIITGIAVIDRIDVFSRKEFE